MPQANFFNVHNYKFNEEKQNMSKGKESEFSLKEFIESGTIASLNDGSILIGWGERYLDLASLGKVQKYTLVLFSRFFSGKQNAFVCPCKMDEYAPCFINSGDSAG